MKQYRFMENGIGKIAFGAFLFAMLLLARDTMITTVVIGFERSQFLMLGIICAVGLAFLAVNRRNLKQIVCDRRMIVIAASTVILLLPMLIKRDWQLMYFSILICLYFAVFLTYFTDSSTVAKYYVVCLAFLGLYSLICTYALREPARLRKFYVPIFYNASGFEFFNFGLCVAVTWDFWNRNFGIFREPGVYQFFVILALYLNNYAVSWGKQWKLWLVNGILVMTMLSTFSIGGFAEMGLFAVFLYFDKKWYKEKWGKIAGVLGVAVVIAAVLFIINKINTPFFELSVFYEFYDMYVRLTTDSDSLVDRLDAIITDLMFFIKNPLVGNSIAEVLHSTNHNTSSSLILYAIFGIVGGTLNVLSWMTMTWKKERNLIGNLVILAVLFMAFNTQNLVADVFFWLFPTMALVERGLPKLKLPGKKM